MVLSYGHQAVARFVEETDPGVTPTDPAFLLFSRETQNVSFGLDKDGQESLDIGEVDVEDLFTVRNAYSVSVEFHVYDEQRALDFLTRNADGTLKSYTLDIIPDQDATSPHYIRARGWRVGTWDLSGGDNEPWVVTITFIGGVIDTPTTVDPGLDTTGSRELKSAITDPIRHWASGAITVDGAPVAILMDSFSLSVENNAEAHYTTGDADPVAAAVTHGVRRYTGSASFSLDDGTEEHWSRVDAYAEHTVEIPFGTVSGDGILNLSGVRFPNIDVDIGVDTDILMADNPFQGLAHTVTAVA